MNLRSINSYRGKLFPWYENSIFRSCSISFSQYDGGCFKIMDAAKKLTISQTKQADAVSSKISKNLEMVLPYAIRPFRHEYESWINIDQIWVQYPINHDEVVVTISLWMSTVWVIYFKRSVSTCDGSDHGSWAQRCCQLGEQQILQRRRFVTMEISRSK